MEPRILVTRFSSLGDIVLASAPVLNLSIHFPERRIVFLTKQRFADLPLLFDGVDEVITLPERGGFTAYLGILERLDDGTIDTLVDLHGNIRSWLARRYISAPSKVVYWKRRWERWLTVTRKRIPAEVRDTITIYNDCLEQLGVKSVCRRPILAAGSSWRSNSHQVPPRESSVVIAPGAAHPNKQWAPSRFVEVANALHRECGAKIIWAVTSSDRVATGLERSVGRAGYEEHVDAPLPRLAGIIGCARLVIANDSGIGHLSSAVGTPVVSVFGPTHPALGFAPKGQFDRVVQVDEYCRPCSLHGKKPCFRQTRYCFERISPEDVLREATDIYKSPVNTARALFMDRDGTVIVEKRFLGEPEKVELEQGAVEGLRRARQLGFKLVVVSNQSGVARGYFDIATVERVNARVRELLGEYGVEVDAMYYCPYHPDGAVLEYTGNSDSRKPSAGMAEKAAVDLGVDLRRSYVVGDRLEDIHLARVIGAQPILVRTGYGRQQERLPAAYSLRERLIVAENLGEAIAHIEDREGR